MARLKTTQLSGAIGAMFYVEPFSTQDIDVLVVTPETEKKIILKLPGLEYLKAKGYTEIRGESVVVEGWSLQFLPVSNPLEDEAYFKAQHLAFEDITVRVVLAEHLVAIMLGIGRLKDLARIQAFLSQDAVNPEALQDILERHGLTGKWDEFRNRFLS